jgi:hypothetical protein
MDGICRVLYLHPPETCSKRAPLNLRSMLWRYHSSCHHVLPSPTLLIALYFNRTAIVRLRQARRLITGGQTVKRISSRHCLFRVMKADGIITLVGRFCTWGRTGMSPTKRYGHPSTMSFRRAVTHRTPYIAHPKTSLARKTSPHIRLRATTQTDRQDTPAISWMRK